MSKTHFEAVEIDKAQVTIDVSMIASGDMYFNATEMARPFDRKVQDYTRLDSTKRYAEAIETRYGISRNDMVRKKRGGKYQGTWLHKKLALDFARWLSACFAVELDAWVEQRLAEEKDRQRARLEARTGYLPMAQAILEAHGDPKGYHFSNEADLINRIVLGVSAKRFKQVNNVKRVRDALSASQLFWIEKLQRVNTGLIEVGLSYNVRKAMLSDCFEGAAKLAA